MHAEGQMLEAAQLDERVRREALRPLRLYASVCGSFRTACDDTALLRVGPFALWSIPKPFPAAAERGTSSRRNLFWYRP